MLACPPFMAQTLHARGPHEPSLQVVLDEALAMVLAPSRAQQVVREALELSGLTDVPKRPVALRIFVEGALFTTISRHLDIGSALEISAQIRGALGPALRAGGVDDHPGSDIRIAKALPLHRGRAIVATSASIVVFLLQDILGDDVELMPASSEDELVDRLRRSAGQPLLIVIDRRHPCVDTRVCSTLRRQLDDRSAVVWWSAPEDELREVDAELFGGPQLIPTESEATLADLGELCRNVLDPH